VRRDAMVEVVQGLAPGDQVVTTGSRLARDGQPVRVLPPGQGVPPAGAAPAEAEAPKRDQPPPASAPKSEGVRQISSS